MILLIIKAILGLMCLIFYIMENRAFIKTRDSFHGISSIIWLLMVIWCSIS